MTGPGGVLAPGGALSGALDGYEDRPAQRQLADAVARAIAGDRALLAEAGTGTGKTLAYLAPAVASGRRVVVSTGTRTLQDQLARADIPLLERALGREIRLAPLKGISNYLCQRRTREVAGRAALAQTDPALEALLAWAGRTETGDRAEIDTLADDAPIWGEVTADAESRLGPRCPFYERCFVTRARRRADAAEIVLVNHHLFFADLALRSEHPGARVLPDYDAVVFDEAHQLEDVITEHFGVAISSVAVAGLARDAREALAPRSPARPLGLVGETAADRIAGHLERSAAVLWRLVRATLAPSAGADVSRIALPEGTFAAADVQDAWFVLDAALEELGAHAALRAEDLAGDPDTDDDAEAARAIARRAGAGRTALAAIAEPDPERFAYWGQVRGAQVALRASPVDVSRVLPEHLLPKAPAVVLTSATLSTAGDFSYTRARLGLGDEVADEIAVRSPFDYGRQALLYVPRDLPAPAEEGFARACADRIRELAGVTGGRALALFTSHRALREASGRLRDRGEFPVLVQGEGARAHLLDRFRAAPGAILCATGSFWQGVDIPGDALSLVVIDKLPFAAPSDPLAAARMRALERRELDPFAAYQLPQAALALKQGLGRLIRRRGDRGIAAVLDRRLVARGYGRVFLDSLPGELPRTGSLERVRRWWTAYD